MGLQTKLRKAEGSAIWINSASEVLQPNNISKLKEAGVGSVFIQGGRLEPTSLEVVDLMDQITLPMGLTCTIVFTGEIKGGFDSGKFAERIAEAFRVMQLRVEKEAGLVAGLHLDISLVEQPEAYGLLLNELKERLRPEINLSVSIQRKWLSEEWLKKTVEKVDFIVPFLFGQRIDESDDPNAWNLTGLQMSLQKVEDLGIPYLFGVIGTGTATWVAPNGLLKERITRIAMGDLIRNANLQLRSGFSLEGSDRRIYSFEAQRATAIASWNLSKGDSIRVVRLASSDFEELLRRLDLWRTDSRIGVLYYRIPGRDELLSLSAENIASALRLESLGLDLNCEVAVQRRTGRGWLLRFSLVNTGSGSSELAFLDNNYLEVATDIGHFGSVLDPGEFRRIDLLRNYNGKQERTFREPNVLRLYSIMLEGRQIVTSGDIEIVTVDTPSFVISGKFLLQDGKSVMVGPFEYRNGTLTGIH